ncbi:DUF5658 family protein [Jeotgalibacillus proteolyticus]|uniref:DUF5658 family protein n=1 Tax=Jeotgalibacillus proteolyticus TaxID=2082395 RepID=UPI003CF72E64
MKAVTYYLSILNLLDGVITHIGLSYSFIEEANPFMRMVYDMHPFLFLTIKLVLSLALILFISYDRILQKPWFKIGISAAALLYTGVFFLHMSWVAVKLPAIIF